MSDFLGDVSFELGRFEVRVENPAFVLCVSLLLAMITYPHLLFFRFVSSFVSHQEFSFSIEKIKRTLFLLDLRTHFIKRWELVGTEKMLDEIVECRIKGKEKTKDLVFLPPFIEYPRINRAWP